MKHFSKKKAAAVLALVLCAAFLLPGCASRGPADKGESSVQQNMSIPNHLAVRQDDVLYFTEMPEDSRLGMIYALDLASGEVMPLCSKPDCTHDSKDCGGYFDFNGRFTNITVYNGELYWVNTDYNVDGGDMSVGPWLYRQRTDGTGREKVMALDPEFEQFSEAFCGIYDGKLYRCGYCQGVIDDAPASYAVVYSRELQKGSDPKEIYRFDASETEDVSRLYTLARMNGGVLYFAIYKGTDNGYLMDLFAYDMENDELEQLYSGASRSPAGDMFYRDGKLIFHVGFGSDAVYAYSIEKNRFDRIYGLADTGSVVMGGETMLEIYSMTGYRVYDLRGNLLFEGERDLSQFHEERQAKQYVGCVDDVFYFYEDSMGGDGPRYNYLVSYNGKTGEFKKLWETPGK